MLKEKLAVLQQQADPESDTETIVEFPTQDDLDIHHYSSDVLNSLEAANARATAMLSLGGEALAAQAVEAEQILHVNEPLCVPWSRCGTRFRPNPAKLSSRATEGLLMQPLQGGRCGLLSPATSMVAGRV